MFLDRADSVNHDEFQSLTCIVGEAIRTTKHNPNIYIYIVDYSGTRNLFDQVKVSRI